MLLVVGHPAIGSALETLLRIEDRYEVRRAQSLRDALSARDAWAPDVALVDGVLVADGSAAALAVPTIVLSGNQVEGKRLLSKLPAGKAWLRKDATATDLRVAIDGVLGQRFPAISARAISFAVAAAVVIAVALIIASALARSSV